MDSLDWTLSVDLLQIGSNPTKLRSLVVSLKHMPISFSRKLIQVLINYHFLIPYVLSKCLCTFHISISYIIIEFFKKNWEIEYVLSPFHRLKNSDVERFLDALESRASKWWKDRYWNLGRPLGHNTCQSLKHFMSMQILYPWNMFFLHSQDCLTNTHSLKYYYSSGKFYVAHYYFKYV